jgi:cytochrome c-type biogenesis protein CcmF
VRSGVLTSVHAFANDPRRGIYILALLTTVIGGSLGLFAVRAPRTATGGQFSLVSREALLLSNNVLLLVAAGAVLLGTLYPLAIDALGLGKLSVGPPYFNTVFVPLMVPLLVLIAIGPLARWKEASVKELARRLTVPAIVALVAGISLPFAFAEWKLSVAIGIALAMWIVAATVESIRGRIAVATVRQPRGWYGMHLAHFGLAVTVAGITLVKGYESEKDVRMAPGETVAIGGYTLRMLGVRAEDGPNYLAQIGTLELARDGRVLRTLQPEKRKYLSSEQPMTEAAIDTGLTGDVYVSLGEPLDGGAWSVRVHHKPFVDWIWGGALLMALGGFLAATDRRYRLKLRERAYGALAGSEARI